MFTLKHMINFNKLYFIFASYNGRLGSADQIKNNGMCWTCPGELKVFRDITRNYTNHLPNVNALIVGKKTAKLIPIDKMTDRDIYILDFCKDPDSNELDSILYRVTSNNEIIEDLDLDKIQNSDLEWDYLDRKLEDLTQTYNGNVFIIGGASVYKYFLDRFPLMCGFISMINHKKIPWTGMESSILYSPINTPVDNEYHFDTYISHENFYCVKATPNAYKIRKTYDEIKKHCGLVNYTKVHGHEVYFNYDESEAVFEVTFDDSDLKLYTSINMKLYVDLFIFNQDKTFILEEWLVYDQENDDSEDKRYYVLHGKHFDEILILLER